MFNFHTSYRVDARKVTAVIFGDGAEPTQLAKMFDSVQNIARHFIFVLSESKLRQLGDNSPAGAPNDFVLLSVPDSSSQDQRAVLLQAISKGLKISPISERFLVVSASKYREGFEIETRLHKLLGKASYDYVSGQGWMMLSRQYAEQTVKSGTMPGSENARANGYVAPMSIGEMIRSPREAIRQNWTMVKFAMVGASGVIVNLLFLTIFKSFSPSILIANGVAVEISIINNFVWNDRFTFKNRIDSQSSRGLRRALERLGKYNLVSVTSFIVNEAVFAALSLGGLYYIWSSLIAILSSFIINYIGSARWAWQKQNQAVATTGFLKLDSDV